MNNNKIALIQLLSEQTMQNVLPVLALKPARLVHLATPKVADRSQWIEAAARQGQVDVTVENVMLSPMPTIRETSGVVGDQFDALSREGFQVLINFTGGTKLMSIGAFAGALKAKCASFYVDTEYCHFIEGGTGESASKWFGEDLSFTPYQRALTVNMIAVANGRERVTNGQNVTPFVPLAELLLCSPDMERRVWEALDGRGGLFPGGNEPRSAGDWVAKCKRALDLPKDAGQLAEKAGLVEQREGKFFLRDPKPEIMCDLARTEHRPTPAYFDAMRPLQFAHSMLAGGWWEVAVADAARKSGRFRDLRWSCAAGQRGFGGSMEEDVLAVDGVRIAYFSCKRGGGGAKLTRQLEEMHASAERLGGRFVTKYFCVCLPLPPSKRNDLYDRAGQLGVRIVTGDMILQGKKPFG